MPSSTDTAKFEQLKAFVLHDEQRGKVMAYTASDFMTAIIAALPAKIQGASEDQFYETVQSVFSKYDINQEVHLNLAESILTDKRKTKKNLEILQIMARAFKPDQTTLKKLMEKVALEQVNEYESPTQTAYLNKCWLEQFGQGSYEAMKLKFGTGRTSETEDQTFLNFENNHYAEFLDVTPEPLYFYHDGPINEHGKRIAKGMHNVQGDLYINTNSVNYKNDKRTAVAVIRHENDHILQRYMEGDYRSYRMQNADPELVLRARIYAIDLRVNDLREALDVPISDDDHNRQAIELEAKAINDYTMQKYDQFMAFNGYKAAQAGIVSHSGYGGGPTTSYKSALVP